MAWQSGTINPATTSPAADISKITNDLSVIKSVIGGGTDADVPVGGGLVATPTNSATTKSTPVNADTLGFVDSVTGLLAKMTFANLWTWIVSKLASVSGSVLVTSASGLIGYGTGSGGTVTQATSKSTAVTLNKPTGSISSSNSSLAAGGVATFVFNNTTIGAYDVLALDMGASAGQNYNVWTCGQGAGYRWIAIKNISAGALSDSVGINFTVLKGSAS